MITYTIPSISSIDICSPQDFYTTLMDSPEQEFTGRLGDGIYTMKFCPNQGFVFYHNSVWQTVSHEAVCRVTWLEYTKLIRYSFKEFIHYLWGNKPFPHVAFCTDSADQAKKALLEEGYIDKYPRLGRRVSSYDPSNAFPYCTPEGTRFRYAIPLQFSSSITDKQRTALLKASDD